MWVWTKTLWGHAVRGKSTTTGSRVGVTVCMVFIFLEQLVPRCLFSPYTTAIIIIIKKKKIISVLNLLMNVLNWSVDVYSNALDVIPCCRLCFRSYKQPFPVQAPPPPLKFKKKILKKVAKKKKEKKGRVSYHHVTEKCEMLCPDATPKTRPFLSLTS